MGVHGLWRLIEPSGKPVPLETLENKVLAVDISIWLHQSIKGFQDSRGASLPNAHLLGIYHRVCKLLYFKIKPVFVFDGGVPILKKQTMAKRQQLKTRNQSEADRVQKQLISALLKHSAISNVLSEKTKANISPTKSSPEKSNINNDINLFALPSSMDSTLSSGEDEEPLQYIESSDDEAMSSSQLNIHNINTESNEFKSLPADVRYEILSEVKETRKQSSWGRIHELPLKSDDFSVYQMGRLLQRQNVQNEIEKTEKEMGGHSLSLAELESLMNDQGVITKNDIAGKRIASDENTKFLLIKDVKQAIEEAQKACLKEESLKGESDKATEVLDIEKLKPNLKKKIENKDESKTDKLKDSTDQKFPEKCNKTVADLEYEEDLERAIKLSLECVSEENAEGCNKQSDDNAENPFNITLDCSYIDEESDSEEEVTSEMITKMTSAQSYMLEYSGLTPNEIAKIIRQNCDKKNSDKKVVKFSNKKSTKKETISDKLIGKISTRKFIANLEKVNDTEATSKKNNDTGTSEKLSLSTKIAVNKSTEPVEDNLFKDIFTENTETRKRTEIISESAKETSSNRNDTEIMSDSDSSFDVLRTEKKISIKTNELLEIIVNPSEAVEDDLFKDIFEKVSNEENHCKNNSKSKRMPEKDKITSESTNEVEFMSDSDESDDFVDVAEQNVTDVDKTKESPTKLIIIDNIHTKTYVRQQKDETVKENTSSTCDNTVSELETKSVEKTNQKNTENIMSQNIMDIEQELAKMHSEEDINAVETAEKEAIQNEKDNNKIQEAEEKSPNKADSEEISKPSTSETKQDRLTIGDLQEMKEELRKEQFKLQSEKSLKERLAGNITDQMYQEAQELLELFGVPYIIAPMEAEAQCAFLDEVNLTDGTITDDSDIWLFGGKTVYKNFFNQSKHVMEFRAENISHHFKLSREQMILLALLVGSDYTTGIQGIGPVTALEILAAFPPAPTAEFSLTHNQLLSGLAEFRNWFTKGKTPGLARTALRSKLKNVKFSESFPSTQVVEAYLQPKVETSREKFSWAKPDIVGLTDFARHKFGWTMKKSEEILNPVIKRLEEKHSQKTIRDYFKTESKIISTDAENKMSKRVKTAIRIIGNEPLDEDEPKPKQKRPRRKKKGDDQDTKTDDPTENSVETSEGDQIVDHDFAISDDSIKTKRPRVKTSKKSEDETGNQKPKSRGRKKKNTEDLGDFTLDEDVRILQAAASQSSKRVKEINDEIENEIKQAEVKKAKAPNLHKKEVIPQRERDKAELMKKKLKAIEIFRKSHKGPGYVAKRAKQRKALKEDAGLSESSSDEN